MLKRVLPLCIVIAVVALPARVEAHSASNTPSSNYVTSVVSVKADPGSAKPSGFTLRSIEAGSRLELRWLSGDEIQVPDYDGHPYLRIGSAGTFENTQSNSTYLNRDRNGATQIVSLSAVRLLAPIGPNRFDPELYYRLNAVHLELQTPDDPDLHKIR